MPEPKSLTEAREMLALTENALALSSDLNGELRSLLAQALEESIHAPSCAYLHHDVDPVEVAKCNCWKKRAATILGRPIPPATGVARGL